MRIQEKYVTQLRLASHKTQYRRQAEKRSGTERIPMRPESFHHAVLLEFACHRRKFSSTRIGDQVTHVAADSQHPRNIQYGLSRMPERSEPWLDDQDGRLLPGAFGRRQRVSQKTINRTRTECCALTGLPRPCVRTTICPDSAIRGIAPPAWACQLPGCRGFAFPLQRRAWSRCSGRISIDCVCRSNT